MFVDSNNVYKFGDAVDVIEQPQPGVALPRKKPAPRAKKQQQESHVPRRVLPLRPGAHRQDVATWVLDAAAFDDDPDFLPPFEALEGAFGALEVIYAKRKRPVQIERIDGQRLAEDVEEAVTVIVDACEPETAAEVSARLRASVQAYSIEFDEMLASEEAWELVYNLDARIAQELDGIIFVRDEAVYGAEGNQMICDLT